MFEIGFTEILLILGIALLVLGPEKLPGLARQVGRWAGRARSMARQLRDQLDDEVLRSERDWARPVEPYKPPAAPQTTGDARPDPASATAAAPGADRAGPAPAGTTPAAPPSTDAGTGRGP